MILIKPKAYRPVWPEVVWLLRDFFIVFRNLSQDSPFYLVPDFSARETDFLKKAQFLSTSWSNFVYPPIVLLATAF